MSDFDLAEAHRAHAAELLGFALNALADSGAAEECVQDTFTKAWQARDRFDPSRASLRTWLFAIARNVVIDQARARARRPIAAPEATVAHEARWNDRRWGGAQPNGISEQVDDRISLSWAIAQLSPEHRDVVVAVRIRALSYGEHAAASGVPVATLRTRMFHALKELRRILTQADNQEDAR